ncbi:MAG: GyrI-like domain-containing protein [Anaerolineae bacterium]
MAQQTKLDLKKELQHLYKPSKKDFSVVDVPPLAYLMIDGEGNPNTSAAYADAVSALYGRSYAIRSAAKADPGITFTVMPLEGLWWMEDMSRFSAENKDEWLWTMMILQPEFVTAAMVEAAREVAVSKKEDLAGLRDVRFETYDEGRSAQILYVGPYTQEAPTIAALHAFISEQGGMLAGKHHEIYLSDPRRTAPEKLKTAIRQPFH